MSLDLKYQKAWMCYTATANTAINVVFIKIALSICCFSSDPYRGLLNEGATCYLSAALQVLFMTEAFRERVLLGSVLFLFFSLVRTVSI